MESESGTSFASRLSGVLRLKRSAYQCVDQDRQATVQAIAVVTLSSIANGVGVTLTGSIDYPEFVIITSGNVLIWLIFAGVAYAIGVAVLPGGETASNAHPSGILRTLGFAQAPNALGILAIAGVVGQFVSFLGLIWVLVCGIAALEVSLRVSTLRAIAIGLVAGIITLFGAGFVLNLLDIVII